MKKIIGIIIMMLFIGTAILPVYGTMNIQSNDSDLIRNNKDNGNYLSLYYECDIDVCRYETSTGYWRYDINHESKTDKSSGPWGISDDKPFAGDFDCDGVNDDVGFFRESEHKCCYDLNHDGSTDDVSGPHWGEVGDLPFAGDFDFDPDGFNDDVGVFRPSTGRWYYDLDHNGDTDYTSPNSWGLEGDLPIAGDFNGDGYDDDVGVFRPSTGIWYYDFYHDGTTDYHTDNSWGFAGDLPFVGDFDCDWFNDDVGVFRPSTGRWYYDFDHNGDTDYTSPHSWGGEGDLPIAGDFDDGDDDPNVCVGPGGIEDYESISTYDAAQSFKPTKDCRYTRIRLPLSCHGGYSKDVTVSLKEGLDLPALSTATYPGSDISTEGEGINFDLIPDVDVEAGKTYYIVVSVQVSQIFEYIEWNYLESYDPYIYGSAWYERSDGWHQYWGGMDFCFTTYQGNTEPNDPSIMGTTMGQKNVEYWYLFSAYDRDRDHVEFMINWGDGSPVETHGYYQSAFTGTAPHIWTSDGTFDISIKARDIHGAESDWTILGISIAKNRMRFIDNPIFERLSAIFPFLKTIS